MAAGKTIKNLDVSIHAIEELTGFNSISVAKLHQHTASDPDLRLLIDHINNGFPDTSDKCPECILPYFSFKDELSTCNELVLKGNNRVVVPASLRQQIFSEHGMPVAIRCDRGRNFMSDLFQQYCSHLGISLSYSSAYHHSANLVERAIRTVKSLMKKCTKAKQSWRLALLEYLASPLDSKTPSPS